MRERFNILGKHAGKFQTCRKIKRTGIILILLSAFLVSGFSQMIPKGMKYQAVARNPKGEIIPNQKIRLKVFLFSSEFERRTNHYIETHETATNETGYFDLIVGEGNREGGEFGLIPWASNEIWMEVALHDRDRSGFATVSSSKLMAVPYAFHAGIAGGLAERKEIPTSSFAPPEPGVVSDSWSVFGNAQTNLSGNPYHVNSLGTTDNVDLILITNNVEMARILKSGDIVTKLNFEVGQNLKTGQNLHVPQNAMIGDSLVAEKNVLFNTLGGATLNFGPFTVAKMSPSLLSGRLTVNLATDLHSTLTVDGPTDLNDSLTVNNMSPTKFTGTLQVDSITDLNDALKVNNISPVALTGDLLVDSCATFMDKVKILSQYSTDTSGALPSGSLQVGGGAYIKENFYVGGIAKFGGPVGFGGAVAITDLTQSTSPNTGALRVSGGVGIGLNLNVGGAAMIAGMLTIKDLTESIDSTTGALKVLGGVGIKKRLNVGGNVAIGNTLFVNKSAYLNDLLNVSSSEAYVASFTNTGNYNGISIQVNDPAPGNANNFMEFRNNNGPGVVGRIEGENISEYKLNPAYIKESDNLQLGILAAVVSEGLAVVKLAVAAKFLIAAATSASFCAGFGIMVCAPVPSLIVKGVLDVAAAIPLVAGGAIVIADATTRYQDWKAYKDTHIGVTYESSAGDYAEWLPKANPRETLLPGYIVGLKNGRISKNLDGATRFMVISTNPIVLGNMQEQSAEMPYEKVAFLGQVPVHVVGKVNIGDYIVPSGDHDGLGVAIPPSQMQVEDYSRIVGVAWTASEKDNYRPTRVAIGLSGNAISKVVLEQKNKLENLRVKINKRNEILKKLVPSFDKIFDQSGPEPWEENRQNKNEEQMTGLFHGFNPDADIDFSIFKISREQVSDLFKQAEKLLIDRGVDLSTYPFWEKLTRDPASREAFIDEIQQKTNAKLEEAFNEAKKN